MMVQDKIGDTRSFKGLLAYFSAAHIIEALTEMEEIYLKSPGKLR